MGSDTNGSKPSSVTDNQRFLLNGGVVFVNGEWKISLYLAIAGACVLLAAVATVVPVAVERVTTTAILDDLGLTVARGIIHSSYHVLVNWHTQLIQEAQIVSQAVNQNIVFEKDKVTKEDRRKSIRVLGNWCDMNSPDEPFIRFFGMFDYRNISGDMQLARLDGVQFESFFPQNSHKQRYPLLSENIQPAGHCLNITVQDTDAKWSVLNDTVHKYNCLDLSQWPGVAAFERGSFWFGPYISPQTENHPSDLHMTYVVPKQENGRSVLVGVGVFLSKMNEMMNTSLHQIADSVHPPKHMNMVIFDKNLGVVATTTGQSVVVTRTKEDALKRWTVLDRIKLDELNDTRLRESARLFFQQNDIKKINSSIISREVSNSSVGLGAQIVAGVRLWEGPSSDWVMFFQVDEDELNSNVKSKQLHSTVGWIVGALFFGILGSILTRFISKPIANISEEMLHIEENDFTSTKARLEHHSKLYEVHQLQIVFERLINGIEERNRLVSEMNNWRSFGLNRISHIFHEIRNPLNGICGLAEVAQNDVELPTLEEYKANMGTIASLGDMLSGILNDTIDIAKLDYGKEVIMHEEPFVLKTTMKDVMSIFKSKLKEKALWSKVKVDKSISTIIGDRHRVSQILVNFVSNAIKFTDSGGITVSAKLVSVPVSEVDGNAEGGARRASAGLEIVLDVSPSIPRKNRKKNDDVDIELGAVDEASTPVSGKMLRYVRVEIKDTGIGVLPENQSLLFEMFSQVPMNPRYEQDDLRGGGAGLGLALTRKLVEIGLKGQVGIESTGEEGQGSVFWFMFPYRPCGGEGEGEGENENENGLDDDGNGDGSGSANAADATHLTTPPHGRRLTVSEESSSRISSDTASPSVGVLVSPKSKVLIVDDGLINRKVAGRMLNVLGVQNIDTAENGLEAVETVKEKGIDYYDLILMDLEMPVLDGLGAVKRIRELGCTKPILALTGRASEADISRCDEVGFTGHLAKPVRKAVLLEVLREHLADAVQRGSTSLTSMAHLELVQDPSSVPSPSPKSQEQDRAHASVYRSKSTPNTQMDMSNDDDDNDNETAI